MKKATKLSAVSVVTILMFAGAIMAARMGLATWFLQAWGKWLEAGIGLVSATSATFAWWQSRQARKEAALREEVANQLVTIILTSGEETVVLPYQPRRREISRAELMGLVGNFYGAGRFNFPNMAALLSSGVIGDIQDGLLDEIKIEIPMEDLKKFRSFINPEESSDPSES